MSGLVEMDQVAGMMISTRPGWLLPWVCCLALVGAAVVLALVLALGMAAVTAACRKGRGR